ncbi:MAG: hypothetical protein K0S56_4785, partial [Microvirga sp.]|nr:hypothetical protein [Microvirga sp.]
MHQTPSAKLVDDGRQAGIKPAYPSVEGDVNVIVKARPAIAAPSAGVTFTGVHASRDVRIK